MNHSKIKQAIVVSKFDSFRYYSYFGVVLLTGGLFIHLQ